MGVHELDEGLKLFRVSALWIGHIQRYREVVRIYDNCRRTATHVRRKLLNQVMVVTLCEQWIWVEESGRCGPVRSKIDAPLRTLYQDTIIFVRVFPDIIDDRISAAHDFRQVGVFSYFSYIIRNRVILQVTRISATGENQKCGRNPGKLRPESVQKQFDRKRREQARHRDQREVVVPVLVTRQIGERKLDWQQNDREGDYAGDRGACPHVKHMPKTGRPSDQDDPVQREKQFKRIASGMVFLPSEN